MKQNLQFFLLFGLLFTLAACEEGVLGPRQPFCQEERQENSNGSSFDRFYNNDRITDLYASANGNLLYYHQFTYDDKGRVIENNYHDMQNNTVSPPEIIAYDEKGNWVKSTVTYSNGNEVFYTIEYDAQNQMKKLTSSSKRAGAVSVNFTIDYDWEGGNNVKRTYISSVMRQEITYEFDLSRQNKRRKEQEKLAFLSLAVAHNRNMYRKYTTISTDIASGAVTSTVQNFEYEYNSQGYPIQLTRTTTTNSASPVTTTTLFHYSCE
ncbi:hypothetical protein ACMA1I_05375 [Pontibacter sp. 13R65]|uniref:hypothetical protein n=1 Tax=Pontibacter sp. 13R65 TaxID=3127458 RepID=UPI00301DEC5C